MAGIRIVGGEVDRRRGVKVMMKLTVACTLTSLMLLCTPVLACENHSIRCRVNLPSGRRTAGLFRASFPAGAVASRPRA